MKKLLFILAAIVMSTSLLISCASEKPEEEVENNDTVVETPVETPDEEVETPDETPVETPDAPAEVSKLDGYLAAITEKVPTPFMAGPVPFDLANDEYNMITYYTGLADASAVDSVAIYESMIGSQAYSLVLVDVKDDTAASEVATQMHNGIDQRKWMCVEADQIRTVVSGDTVMLIMIDSQLELSVDDYVNAFVEVVGEVEFEAQKN